MGRNRTYSDAFACEFRILWESGLSTAAMGEKLGVTKNVVCGIRRRMELPERGSPLKPPSGNPPRPKPRKPRAPRVLAQHDLWLPWFNRLSAQSRRLLALAVHPSGCPARGGMWLCACGLTQPGSPLLRRAEPVDVTLDPVDETPDPVDGTPEPVAGPGPRVFAHCGFPIGTPGRAGFRYCEAPIYERRTIYCASCRDNAYVEPERGREAAAAG